MGAFLDMQMWYEILAKVCVVRHEIFIETKKKVCYMIENLSPTIDVEIFFFMESSNFPPGLALHATAG